MTRLLAALLIFVLPLSASAQTYRQWSVSQVADAASVFASKLSREQAEYLLFMDFSDVPPGKRVRKLQALSAAVNSLSTNDLIVMPQFVPDTEGALAWIDISTLRDRRDKRGVQQLRKALDRLGELGSGPAPLPEPFYHAITFSETKEAYTVKVRELDPSGKPYFIRNNPYEEWQPSYVDETKYKTTTKQVVSLSPALNKASIIGLVALTRTNFPIFRYRWFVSNALVEPRYHELLGLDDTEASVLKLANVNEKDADRIGSQLRGAVLFSEVAHRNRILERTPTGFKYGRGSFHKSFDFLKSIQGSDVLRDTLISESDANEIIWTLPNGLLAYSVQAKGKRLDKADADIAIYRKNLRWQDPQVRTAYVCMDCHMRQKGWMEVDDEVAQFANRKITLAVQTLAKGEGDRGRRVRQKYLTTGYNELLQADQALFEASVRAATGGLKQGLTCAETASELMGSIEEYIQRPVTLTQLATELGAPKARVLRAIKQVPGIDHSLVGVHEGRPQRRDHIEAAFSSIATVLYLQGGK